MGPTLARMAARAAGDRPPRHRRVALVVRRRASRRSNSAGVAHRARRPARPRRRRRAARRAERDLHGRPEVRHDRRAGDDVGDEHDRARQLRRALSRLAHRRVLDRKRLSAHAGRVRRARARPTPLGPVGEYAASCVGRERVFELYAERHRNARRDRPTQLRDRPALRRARRHRDAGASAASRCRWTWDT